MVWWTGSSGRRTTVDVASGVLPREDLLFLQSASKLRWELSVSGETRRGGPRAMELVEHRDLPHLVLGSGRRTRAAVCFALLRTDLELESRIGERGQETDEDLVATPSDLSDPC